MMRKNNNNNNRNKHRGGGGGGGRRYQGGGGGGGGNRGNDGQNIARQKHHATQQREKYSNMARDAQINGDRVDVEYYLQHVDHYTRVLTDIAVIEAERHSHLREHTIAAGAGNEGGQDNASSDGAEAPAEGGDQQLQAGAEGQNEQPRQQRQQRPRRHYPDNGAAEANSNTSEIPLPGGILPPV